MKKKANELWHGMEAKSREIWARDDLSSDEKYRECYKLYLEVEEAEKPDSEIEEQRRIIMRHKQLADFYEQNYRYLPEFEQVYRIFEEDGAGDNPL